MENTTCVQGSMEYETDVTNISQNNYLKHEVVNNIITTSYACITYTENGTRKDACVKGADSTPETYASNQAIFRSIELYFNTLDYSESDTGKDYCSFDDYISNCSYDSLGLGATSDGHVSSVYGSSYCDVTFDGLSFCREE